MKVNFSGVLMDIDGTDALDQMFDKSTANSDKPKMRMIPLTAARAAIRALNETKCQDGETMDRYHIIKRLRAHPESVELTENEPEMVRAAVKQLWPPFVYGQMCELMGLASPE